MGKIVARYLCVIGMHFCGVGVAFAEQPTPPAFEGQTQFLCSLAFRLYEPGLFWACLDDSHKTIYAADGNIRIIHHRVGSLKEFVRDGVLVKLAAQPKLVADLVERSEQCAISKSCKIDETAPEKARFFRSFDAATIYWEAILEKQGSFQDQKRVFLVSAGKELVVLTSPLDLRYEGDDPVIVINSYFINQ